MDALLVDDSSTTLMWLSRIIEGEHDVTVTAVKDPYLALTKAQVSAFDFIIVDYEMPGMDGIAFIEQMRRIPHYEQAPIVMITGDDHEATRIAALKAGATDFLSKGMTNVELGIRLHNLVQLASAVRRLAEQAAWLDGQIEAASRQLQEREAELIFRLSLAVEYRDNDTGEHTWRVARYSQLIAEAMGLDPSFCRALYLAAPLHDVGKVAIPDGVLLKPGRLDAEEFALVQTHTSVGGRILGNSSSELIQLAAAIAEAHHERWDGSGYPNGLAGERIPLAARIVAVADVFDALTSQRPYKAAMPFDEALRCIWADAGRHFDPTCVEAFCGCAEQVRRIKDGGEGRIQHLTATEPWARTPALLREASDPAARTVA